MQTTPPNDTPATDSDAAPAQKPYGIGEYRVAGKVRGWRLSMKRRGTWIDCKFKITEYGDMEQALQAAIAFRDQVNQEYAPFTKQEFCATLRSNNTSGVPGVFVTRDGYWKAMRQFPDGSIKSRQFAISKYGAEDAYRRAVAARHELLRMIRGVVAFHPEVRSDVLPAPDSAPALVRQPYAGTSGNSPYAHQRASRIPGVGIAHARSTRKDGTGTATTYWRALIKTPQGVLKRRYFSVKRYGEEGAKRLAIEQRLRWEEEHDLPPRFRL